MQLLFASNQKLDCNKNLFVNEHACNLSFKRVQNKLNYFESESVQFPHVYENLNSLFSNYKLHFNSIYAVLKSFSRPIALPVNSAVGQWI